MTISLEEWKEKKTKSKDEGFTLTIANAVFKYLNALVDDRPKRRTRWIWELLQNAHDASTASDKRLIASIRDNSEELVLLHNGSGFTIEQIQRLIFHGSTKVEDEETIGQYGSGFLTTHLLSWDIDVSGQLDDGQWFDFRLSRNPESVNALSTSMNQAWDDFNPVSSLREPMPEGFTTRFKYPITEIWAKDAVKEGNTTLKQCTPFVVVFNKVFYSIDIKEPCETSSFKVVQRCLSIRAGLWEINVMQNINGNQREMKYLLAQGLKASVTAPLTTISDRPECLSVENTPRLFVAFPLVGTESFSFPAVINGNRKFFKPNENRDGVDLGQGDYRLDTETNQNNQAVIKEACTLLTHLFQHAASNGWHHVYRWAEIPAIQEENEWLRECIKGKFIENTLQSPAILTESGKVIMPEDARLPLAENDENIRELWDLLNDLRGYREKMPRQDEAIGWRNAIKSWAKINECETLELPNVGVIDGRKLASDIKDMCSNLKDLQNLLQENVCAIEWLNRFYGFLKENELFDEAIRNFHIFPNQTGELKPLRTLHLDKGIDKKLKKIDRLLESTIQNQLLDTELIALEDEEGIEVWDDKYVLRELTSTLQDCANNPDGNFKKASTLLFAWIISQNQKEWDHLQDVPVFTKDGKSHHSLRSASSNNTPLLAPASAWPKSLQKFKDLFPSDLTLADDFFKEVDDLEVWKQLNKQDFIRRDIIIQANGTDLKSLSPEVYGDNKDHETAEPVRLTDFIERAAVMNQVRDYPRLGRQFWQFLTEWLVKEDSQGLETKLAKCESCGNEHRYYPAAWMIPVLNNQWIRQKGNLRVSANAKSLASLLRNSEWDPSSLNENPAALKLLEEMDVSLSDLKLGLIAESEEKRNEVINLATTLYDVNPSDLGQVNELVQHAAEGNLSQINAVAQDLKEDEALYEDIEKRRKRRDIVHKNQRLGQQVEELVEENLMRAGFKVEVTGIGSDFKILPDWEDTEDIITLEITNSNDQSWLIEVKSTRYQSVHMSSKQAEMASKEKEKFLLCVVPLGQEEVTLEIVKENIRFIQNIGNSITPLWENFNSLEELREEIIADESVGVKLVCKAGTTGIHVSHSVWENEGFPLEGLAENLK